MPLSVVCVLQKSKDYDTDYVEKLAGGVNKHLGVDLLCIHENSSPGWWCKMALFAPYIHGDVLYLDLDTLIVGDLSDIASVGCLTMLSDFNVSDRLQSGVMYLPEKDRALVWDEWIKNPQAIMDKYRGWGDGGFIGDVLPHAARWQDILPGQVVSYKAHVRKGLMTDDARVVCFHGQPKPRALGWKI